MQAAQKDGSKLDTVEGILAFLGLDNQDNVRERQAFIGLSPKDIDLIRKIKPGLDKHIRRILDEIYNNLQNFPETSKHLTSEARIEALKDAQTDYFNRLFSGKYDLEYVRNVVKVGMAHVRIDLKPQWYLGNYCVYLCKVIGAVFEEMGAKSGKMKLPWSGNGGADGNGNRNLEEVIQALVKAFFLDMALTLDAYVGPLTADLKAKNDKVSARVERLRNLSNDVSSEIRESNENVQRVASAAEEMSSTIKEISGNVQKSTQIANDAVSQSEQASIVMAKLGDSSKEIGTVVKAIRSIAQQTNLLALNATIEAARAGEAGKGFAVVANEVKDLAKETAEATERISRRIEAIQKDTEQAVSSISDVGNIVNQVNDFCVGIAGAVEEQTATTDEISRSITETAMGVSNALKKIEEAEKETK
ncbi:MAG: protoglobin domain-containing protein [Nitrospiria bacterium]